MKCRIPTVLLLLFSLSLSCHSATNEPIFVLIEKNNWAMVMGSDSPSFALYEDGTVIFLKEETEHQYTHYSYQAESAEKLLKQFTPDNTHGLSNYYRLTLKTCQTRTLFLWKDKTVEVYGKIRLFPQKHIPNPDKCYDYAQAEKDSDEEYEQDVKEWKKCPSEIRKIMDQVISLDHPEAKKWLPGKIEVMIWPYENAPEKSILWPAEWPDLEDEHTRQRGKESYSIYVPSENYHQLISFLKTRNKKGAVLINGRKMAVSIRFPFPHEKKWMRKDPQL